MAQLKKIISTVPSLTELLFYLEPQAEIVGRTKYCIHPKEKVDRVPIIGGTKTLDIASIEHLSPDLIVANREENTKAEIEQLEQHCPVLLTDISTFEGALDAIVDIGKAVGREQKARKLVKEIEQKYSPLATDPGPTVCYLIWRKPYMTIGNDTFIHSMLEYIGFKNIFGGQKRYPETTAEEIADLNPDFLFLSSEPLPFKKKMVADIETLNPNITIELVDGEFFSWYGNRMLPAADYFKTLKDTLQ